MADPADGPGSPAVSTSYIFACSVAASPCPDAAQQRLDFVGFSMGPDCGAIFAFVLFSTITVNFVAFKVRTLVSLVRNR